MDIINYNQAGGFPLTTDTLNFMQNAYKIFNAISGLTGNLAIISGCNKVGNTISNGVVAIDGEIYPFEGTTLGAKVIIKEIKTSQTFEDGSSKTVFVKKVATFGNGTKTYPWANFKRIMNNQEIESKTLSDDNSVLKRLEKLEEKLIKTVPIGLVAIWGKPANEPIPEGWREYVPLRGRMPIGHNSADPDFGRIGAEGGEKTHTLTIAEIPRHSHSLFFKRTQDDQGFGSHEDEFSIGSSDSVHTTDEGGDQPHNNMPPYRVIKYIEFVGF